MGMNLKEHIAPISHYKTVNEKRGITYGYIQQFNCFLCSMEICLLAKCFHTLLQNWYIKISTH